MAHAEPSLLDRSAFHPLGVSAKIFRVGPFRGIMRGDRPAEVADSVIENLPARERAGVVVLPDRAAAFKVGGRVRVTAGPMRGLEGLVAGLRAHERVGVLLQALGRIELPKDAVEVIS